MARNAIVRTLKALGLLLAAAFVVLIAYTFHSSKEPRYAGKGVTEWLRTYDELTHGFKYEKGSEDQPTIGACETALRTIGSNSVPTLISLLTRKPMSKGERSVNQSLALCGFHVLGEQARRAIPILVQLTTESDKDLRFTALCCLREVRLTENEAAVVLVPLMSDSDRTIRFYAAEALCDFPDLAQKSHVFQEFPDLAPFPAER